MAARAAYESAEKRSMVPALPVSPLPPAPNFSVPQTKDFRSNLADALKQVILTQTKGSAVDETKAGEQADNFILSIGGISQGAILETKGKLNKVEVRKAQSSIRQAIPYKGELDIKRHPLAEVETLHVLSALPEGEEVDRFDNGYILISHEKPASARLYYLHKDKKDKLVECRSNKRDSLIPLCDHVKSLGEGVKHLTLDCKQQRDLIITPCGGHNYKQAENAVSAPALAKSLSLQSGPSAQSGLSGRASFYAPPKESLFKDHEIILLKDWPKEMADKTLYFKWDESKKMLAVKYKKEDSSISGHERPINPSNVKLVSDQFKQSEALPLTLETRKFLEYFAATPVVRPMSVVLPKGALNQSPAVESDVSVLDSGKEEGVKEEAKEEVKGEVKEEVKEEAKEEVKGEVKEEVKGDVKKGIVEKAEGKNAEIAREDSFDKEANLSSEDSPSKKASLPPSPSLFYSKLPLPLVPVIKASDTNLPVTESESEVDSKLNSEKTSPSL